MNQNRRLADIAQSVVTAAGLDVARDQVVEARLEDRDFAALQGLDAVRILVDTDDRMAEFGETSAGYQANIRSEEHTSALQSLMRISYAVFCLKKKQNNVEIRRLTDTTQQICKTKYTAYTSPNSK